MELGSAGTLTLECEKKWYTGLCERNGEIEEGGTPNTKAFRNAHLSLALMFRSEKYFSVEEWEANFGFQDCEP